MHYSHRNHAGKRYSRRPKISCCAVIAMDYYSVTCSPFVLFIIYISAHFPYLHYIIYKSALPVGGSGGGSAEKNRLGVVTPDALTNGRVSNPDLNKQFVDILRSQGRHNIHSFIHSYIQSTYMYIAFLQATYSETLRPQLR